MTFLTGHNIAQQIFIDVNNGKHTFCDKSWSQDSSTLYCSKICGENWERTIIFAGTALGDVLVWRPIDGISSEERAPILHRLSGHKV